MAGPGGIDPQAQQSSTRQEQGSHIFDRQSQQLSFQPGVFNTALQFAQNIWANNENRKASDRQNEFNRSEASASFDRNQRSANAAFERNKEAKQVSRFLEAGLSPGLIYGQMSDVTAEPATGTPATSGQPFENSFGKTPVDLMAALQYGLDKTALQSTTALNAAQVRNLDANANLSNINAETANARNLQEIQESAARIQQMISQTDLNDATRQRLEKILSSELDLMEQQIHKTSAEVGLVGAQVGKTSAEQKNIEGQTSLIPYQKESLSTGSALNRQKVDESKTTVSKLKSEIDKLRLSYILDSEQIAYVSDWAENHGIDPAMTPTLIKAADEAGIQVPKSVGNILESWLNGNTWLNFINQWRRTNRISDALETGKAANGPADELASRKLDSIYGKDYHENADFARKYRYNLSHEEKEEFDKIYQSFLKDLSEHGHDPQLKDTQDVAWSEAFNVYTRRKKEESDRKAAEPHRRKGFDRFWFFGDGSLSD